MSRPTWARWVTRISLVIALVALALTIRDTGIGTIVRYFRRIGWWWFAVLALEVAITSLDAVAIRAFLSPEQALVKLRSALLSQLAGRSVNAVTPTGNLGEAVKISVLTEHVSQSRAVATILLYNVVSFCVELGMVAIAAPLAAWLVPMPPTLRTLMFVAGAVCFVLTIGLYTLVHFGVLSSIARLARSLRILSERGFAKWHDALLAVDDKMRLQAGARRRDRGLGIVAVVVSRGTSMTLSLLILHAVGEPITLGFVAAYTVGGFVIYMLSTLVPMGLGISEGGNWELFRALGENPARGVTLVVARRVTLVVYAAIGLVLVAASETVQRARGRRAVPVQAQVAAVALPTARVIDASD
jgi:hypothetical protein